MPEEEIHPDLEDYVSDCGSGMMVHHPLVIQNFRGDATRVNQIYRDKLEECARAEEDGKWRTYIAMHEKPYRLGALLYATDRGLETSPTEYWSLVASVWIGSENIYQDLDNWRRVWLADIPEREACMSSDDRSMLAGLPDNVPVWRGTGYGTNVNGFSWTLDRTKAEWFATRRRASESFLVEGTVDKSEVFAYFGERNEREIVSLNVRIASISDLNCRPSEPSIR